MADLLGVLTTASDASGVAQLAVLVYLARAILRLERRVFAIELRARLRTLGDDGEAGE